MTSYCKSGLFVFFPCLSLMKVCILFRVDEKGDTLFLFCFAGVRCVLDMKETRIKIGLAWGLCFI